MTLSELGNIGEFVGAVAVVVSLVYLAMQIRQNTQTVRASAYHNITAQWANHLQSIADNAELSSLYFRGLADSRSLDAQESPRFFLLMASQFALLEDLIDTRDSDRLVERLSDIGGSHRRAEFPRDDVAREVIKHRR